MYVKNTLAMTILNQIKGDRSRIDDVLNATSEEELNALEWLQDVNMFNPIEGATMGEEPPQIHSTYKMWFYQQDRYGADISDYDCSLDGFPTSRDCVGGIFWRVSDQDYNNFTMYSKPSANLGNFVRVGAYNVRPTSSVNVYGETYKSDLHGLKVSEYYTMLWLNYKTIDANGNISQRYDNTLTSFADEEMTKQINSSRMFNMSDSMIWFDAVFNGSYIPQNFVDFGIINADIDLRCNFYIFNSEEDLDEYLRTGDYSKAINRYEEPTEGDETKDKLYYAYCKKFSRPNATEGDKSYIYNHRTEIKVDMSEIRRPFAFLLDKDTQILNLKINSTMDDEKLIAMRESANGGDSWSSVNLHTFSNDFWRYNGILKVGSVYEGAEIKTNIPIFDSALKIDLYFRGLIDESNALNPDDSAIDKLIDKLIDIGKSPKIKNDLNLQSVRTDMSEIITANSAFFGELAQLFNDDSMTNVLKEGMALHANPYDIFIDFFALPFNVENTNEVSASKTVLDFGTYNHTFTNSFKSLGSAKEITMFSTQINRIYNDWRDYQCNYYLYMPYVNIIPLDVNEIMDRTLTVTFVFDVPSCTIKYFIKVNGVTIRTVEGGVRYSLPMSASNIAQGFANKLNGASQVIKGGTNIVGGVMSADANPIAGVTRAINGGFDLFGGMQDIIRPVPKEYSGNYSNTCAFYDELNCYMIIESDTILYNGIKEAYNIPDNRVSTLATCIGYTEIDYIDLQVNATESERAKIEEILKSGVYV